MSPPPPPPQRAVVDAFFHQLGGGVLAVLGVSISVLGLHGLKRHGGEGSVRQCTMPARWWGYFAMWSAGQLMQLLAVELATEPVVAAVSNFAVIVNLFLAQRMGGERVTAIDVWCMLSMLAGACLVVAFVPRPRAHELDLAQLRQLFAASALPLLGQVCSGVLAACALPAAVLSWQGWNARGSGGGVAFGLLAGYFGATSVSAAKLCWLLFNHYLLDVARLPAAWALGAASFGTELLMVAALFCGMQSAEAAVVVPTYYVTLTLFASLQGLCTFDLLPAFVPATLAGFVAGVGLCVGAVVLMAHARARPPIRLTGGVASPPSPRRNPHRPLDANRLLDVAVAEARPAHGHR